MHFSEFGPFETVFARGSLSVPGYLPLLNLCGGEVRAVLKQIDEVIDESTNPNKYIRRLLQDVNWRMHLVGAVAILLSHDEKNLPVDALWGAFDAGSWVTPQLAVTAFFSDKEFVQRTRDRVEARCPIGMPQGLSPLERHSATGPSGEYWRSCKALASLLAVAKHIPSQAEWVLGVSQQNDVEKMLRDDFDNAGNIAQSWLTNAVQQFKVYGVALEPAQDRQNVN